MDSYKVTVEVTVRVTIPTHGYSYQEAYDNARNDFDNDPQAFIESYNYEVKENSYNEIDAEIEDF